MRRSRSWTTILGLAFVTAYALPLFFPPVTNLTPPADTAGIIAHMFPNVPSWWVTVRLACLAVGTALIVAALAPTLPPANLLDPDKPAPVPVTLPSRWSRPLQQTALLLAVAHALAAFVIERFGLREQTIYLALLPIPALLLAIAERPKEPSRAGRSQRPVLLALPILWLPCVAPWAWRSPRSANAADAWLAVQRIENVARGKDPLLAYNPEIGLTNAYNFLQGLPLLGSEGFRHVFIQLQAVNLIWTLLTGIVVGTLALRLLGLRAAVVVQAAFLFGPYVYSYPYDPLAIYMAPLASALMMLFFLDVRDRRSPAALVGLALVAGFAARNPLIAPVVALMGIFTFRTVIETPRLSWIALLTATCSGIAIACPGLPDLTDLSLLAERFASGSAQYGKILQIFYGQASAFGIGDALRNGAATALETPLEALLTPFQIVREPMRLCGDVLFEPVGVILMSIGVVTCSRALRSDHRAQMLIGTLLLGIVPAFVAPGDQVSHGRMSSAITPIVLLAGVGFESLRSRRGGDREGWGVTVTLCGFIALSGLLLFHVVNPKILPASWLATSFEALGDDPAVVTPTLIDYDGGRYPFGWLHTRRMADQLRREPVPVVTVKGFYDEIGSAQAPPRLYLWSPALDADARLWSRVCARWPNATLYTLWDRPHLFHAFAASPAGDEWRPALPADRWASSRCEGQDFLR